MNACPDCDSPLPQTATGCRCGWQQVTIQAYETNACEYEPFCSGRIFAKVNVNGAWKATCEGHYQAHFRAEAEKGMPEHLKRQPGESEASWRSRALKWLAQNIKREAA